MRTSCVEQPQIGPVLEFTNCCQGKKRYSTVVKAEGFARWHAKRFNKPVQDAYHCSFCHGWHLSKLSQSDATWIIKQKKEEIRRTKKIKKAKWKFCVQNVCVDVPEDEEEESLILQYGETYAVN